MARSIPYLKRLRENAFVRITDILNQIRKDSIPIHKVSALHSWALKVNSDFSKLQDEIEEANLLVEVDKRLDTTAASQAFFDILIVIETTHGERTEPVPRAITAVDNASAAMIPLPSFAGELANWPRFISLYDSLVHNNPALDATRKFQHLSLALTGEAASVLSCLELRPDNYAIAYDALRKRYHSPRRLGAAYLTQLHSFLPVTESSTSQLSHFLDVHRTAVGALRALPLGDLADFQFLCSALNKLDSRTRDAFEQQRPNSPIPTFQELLDFVSARVQQIQLREPAPSRARIQSPSPRRTEFHSSRPQFAPSRRVSSPQPRSPPAFYSSAYRVSPCSYCKIPSHVLRQCDAFKNLQPDARLQVVLDNDDCVNCLSHGHLASQCQSQGRCRVCQRRHHTFLHAPQTTYSATASPLTSALPNRSRSPPLISTGNSPPPRLSSSYRSSTSSATSRVSSPPVSDSSQ